MSVSIRSSGWLFGAVMLLAACGDSVTLVECPLGTRPEGSRCVPIDDVDTVGGDTAAPVDTSAPPLDTVVAADTAVPEDTVGVTDISVDTALAPAPNGGACVKNADCEGGTCLDWPGGYCTVLGCDGTSCGAGSTCVAVEGGNKVCLAECTGDGDCRPGEQACKTVADAVDGSLVEVCVGVEVDAGPTGSPCADSLDCSGAAICLGAFPGGYCAVIGCESSGACPADAGCVRVDGQPTCLKRCAIEADCGGTPEAERSCAVQRTVEGGEALFCASGAGDVVLGAPCLSDFECASGACQILGEGRCSQSQAPCFPATEDDDCNGAEFCFVTGDSRVGVCARACAAGGIACPGASFCVTEGDTADEAWCRPACSADGDECAGAVGLSCHFGIPVSDGGQGRYACTTVKERGFGDACSGDGDCASGECLELGAGGGYCTQPCGFDGYCPFPGFCVFGEQERCQLACLSSLDCPSGFACDLATGSARDVCVP